MADLERIRRLAHEHAMDKHRWAVPDCVLCDGYPPPLPLNITRHQPLTAVAQVAAEWAEDPAAQEHLQMLLEQKLLEDGATSAQMAAVTYEVDYDRSRMRTRVTAKVPALNEAVPWPW